MKSFHVKTSKRTQFVDITEAVERAVRDSGVSSGVCYVYVPHTTAGVTINEHADPDVARDVEGIFDRLVPLEGIQNSFRGEVLLTAFASFYAIVEDGRVLYKSSDLIDDDRLLEVARHAGVFAVIVGALDEAGK